MDTTEIDQRNRADSRFVDLLVKDENEGDGAPRMFTAGVDVRSSGWYGGKE
jgi:hypothetical protein